MSGIFFIVTVPEKKYEEEWKKEEKSSVTVIEKDKDRVFKKPLDDVKNNLGFSTINSNESYSLSEDINVFPKSKSNMALHSEERSVFKSNSVNAINDTSKDSVNDTFIKTSWEDFKHVFKIKKSKLKINSGQGVDILSAFHWDTPLEIVGRSKENTVKWGFSVDGDEHCLCGVTPQTMLHLLSCPMCPETCTTEDLAQATDNAIKILTEILQRVNITNATWNSAMDKNFWQVTFMMESGNLCEELLQVLRTFGIGTKYKSSVCVIPCALYFKSDSSKECVEGLERKSGLSSFSSSVRARNNLEQIIHAVRAEATLTFDWLFLLIVAGFVAAIGLVENSTVILVASMLISPLMSPITASTLGTAVRDRSLQLMGVAHEMLGLFLCLVIGFIFGLVICAVDEHYGVGDWPTYEILSRCEIRSLWVGVLVAIPSGAAVALAILGEYTSSLVGVAISASLLPPAVNAGLLWAMSLVHLVYNDDATRWTGVVKSPAYSSHQPTELAVLGAISLCLTLVNIVCIFLTGVAVYKVKAVCPFERRNMSWWKDNRRLPHMRKYNNFDNWNTYSEWSSKNNTDNQHLEERTRKEIHTDTVTYRKKSPKIEPYSNGKTNIENDLQGEISSIATRGDYEKIDPGYFTQYMNQDHDKNGTPRDSIDSPTNDDFHDAVRHTYDNVFHDANGRIVEDVNPSYPKIDRCNTNSINTNNIVVLDGRSFNV